MSLLGTKKRKFANMILIGALAISPLIQAPNASAQVVQSQPATSATQSINIYQTFTVGEYFYSCRYYRMWYCRP